MQFTVDTRNATAFELNALAEFVQKLAQPELRTVVQFWHDRESSSVYESTGPYSPPAGHEELTFSEYVRLGNSYNPEPFPANIIPDRSFNVEVHLPEGYGALVTEGNAASGAPDLPPVAGPAPEVPPVPGSTAPAVAAAPASTTPTDVPAVPTSVPAVPASTSAADPVGGQVELDSAGCPWSPLIHTSNKATIGDGTWRKKPGVDPAYFESVRNELMGKPTASTAMETDTAPALPASSAPALLTGNDVMARAMEIQMADGTKSAALFQAIQGAGIPAGPMGLPGCTDQAVLAAALAAVNAVGAQ